MDRWSCNHWMLWFTQLFTLLLVAHGCSEELLQTNSLAVESPEPLGPWLVTLVSIC